MKYQKIDGKFEIIIFYDIKSRKLKMSNVNNRNQSNLMNFMTLNTRYFVIIR